MILWSKYIPQIFKLFIPLNKPNLTCNHRLNEIDSVIIGKNVVDNISSGRKVFKFLKFVDEIKNIIDLVEKKAKNGLVVKVMSLFARLCGFFYYVLDNMVWFSNMGMIR